MFLWNEVERIPYFLRACFPKAKASVSQENVVMASHHESLDRSVSLSDWLRVKWAAFASFLVMCSGALRSGSSDGKGNDFSNSQHLAEKQEHGTAFFQTAFPGKDMEPDKVRRGLCERSRS